MPCRCGWPTPASFRCCRNATGLRAKTDDLIARIRGAWEGYTGVFDLVKVDQALLDRVYDHDVGLMHAVEDFVAIDGAAGREYRRARMRSRNRKRRGRRRLSLASPATDNPLPQAALVDAAAERSRSGALPLLAAKLDAIQQSCDQRADLLKGLG